jgi:aminopeptidase N/puromycin-sensitive aminopeptidase
VDAAPTTRPIQSRADTPAEINQQFDSISYGKAGAVIGMVEHYLGPAVFQKGVQGYMQAHKFSNATAQDFWGMETSTSGKPVDAIMKSFVDQPGEPLLTFAPAAQGTLSVTQSRFYLTPQPSAPAQVWTVPVCEAGGSCDLVTAGAATVKASAGAFANADAAGYYRSEYRRPLLKQVIAEAPRLTSPERIDLIGDRRALMQAGQSSVGDYLDLTASLRNDPDAAVLTASFGGVNLIEARIASETQDAQLDAWIRKTFAPVYAGLGPVQAGESEAEVLRRVQLFQLLGSSQDPAVIAAARSNAEHVLAGEGTINPELIQPSFVIAARSGDAALYDKLQEAAELSTNPEQRTRALYVLAMFQNPELVRRTMDYVSSGKVRNQDSWILMVILLSQRETRAEAWAYIKAHWDKVSAQFTTFSGARVVGATGSFCSAEDKSDVQQFFAAHKVAAADRALQHALESIDSCIKLRAEQGPNLTQWLATQSGQ